MSRISLRMTAPSTGPIPVMEVRVKAYYEKKSAEGLRYMNIIGHVSKKMTSVIFAVMRDNKLYEPVLPAA